MSQDINNTVATSKTRRVIKNLRWYVLVLFLLGVTVNYITVDRRRVPDRLYHFPAPVRLAD